ncbi:hypothetical protein HanXRQr2_Chr11g0520121 [Helianthus annuus]|uniref:Uncharacterized protein n=1 Tax=Helianthus annuus TaxID=4232 RepID=A0A9K3N285_HELAN|nr:hypothetical protein HanXRQr2_Chr11g0520121 [Helianthus annuus]
MNPNQYHNGPEPFALQGSLRGFQNSQKMVPGHFRFQPIGIEIEPQERTSNDKFYLKIQYISFKKISRYHANLNHLT